jgi:hypothetical protein
MATKLYDVCVKTGTYTKDGQQKNRYENIGTVMQGDDGGQFMLLKTTFNPAGVPNPENRDTVMCSMFAPQQQQQAPNNWANPQQAPQPMPQQAPQNYAQQQNPQY